ncbi:hypothetical protein [Methylobacterium trifolii]|uniref:Uncharacterized protein n=1 Tax=Methylobacterium trifolii TaxID=1003092 RepID=A0ABQ4TXB4_9HYPH|nr:hypothetical protein [Methylobacterium trifolii]GJE59909.1 hypothetical protein MPOCJGCO_2011 [Methylobacterium trifolii]
MTARATTLLAAASLALLAVPAAAQAPRPPAPPAPPPPMEAIAKLAPPTEGVKRRDFYLKPETESAARDSEAKIDAIQRKIDARVRQATRSICAGCTDAAPPRRQRLAAPRIPDEPVATDPAQAPID